jgi:rod shape-determining protein MreC
MTDNPVQPGEEVRTSGGDRIFPKGLPVGTVTKVGNGSDLFLNIRVRPAANLSKLEEVLVVTKLVEQEPTQLQTGPVRAADILAQRLPSVPDKPAADPEKPKPDGPAKEAANPAAPSPGKTNPTPRADVTPNPRSDSITPISPKNTGAAQSVLQPATAHGPAPAPVKVADPIQPVAPKTKPAIPPARATEPPAQNGPQ